MGLMDGKAAALYDRIGSVAAAIWLGLKAQQAKYKYLACCDHMSLASCASFSERVADYFSASASRNNSLRPILERVFSSTRFTITAAYKAVSYTHLTLPTIRLV